MSYWNCRQAICAKSIAFARSLRLVIFNDNDFLKIFKSQSFILKKTVFIYTYCILLYLRSKKPRRLLFL